MWRGDGATDVFDALVVVVGARVSDASLIEPLAASKASKRYI